MGFLELFFGVTEKTLQQFLDKEALLLDVCSSREFEANHIAGAIHVPLKMLRSKLPELKAMQKPFIVYCESGVRSATATKLLQKNHIEAINGGGWIRLTKRLKF